MEVKDADIVSLAKSIPALSKEQVEQIEQVVPTLDERRKKLLYEKVMNVGKAQLNAVHEELRLIDLAKGTLAANQKKDAREARNEAEAASQEQEHAEADSLIDNL